MKQIGFDPARLTYILITHSDIDHQGGNKAMRAIAPNALFLCHTLDKPWVESLDALENGRYRQWAADHGIGAPREGRPGEYEITVPMDITFEGGETIRLSPDWALEIVHTPGHTWGHSGVYDRASRCFIAAEAALWRTILGKDEQPALPPTYCYVDSYLATIKRLKGMDIGLYASAHWPLKRDQEVRNFLDESEAYCLQVEQKLLNTLRSASHGLRLRELIGILKPEIGSWPAAEDDALAYPLHGNLCRLEDRGLIVSARRPDQLIEWSIT
jgi:glyoxylase-like metal-dependent hydrolase (beta-lactamase superfamily II)